MVLSRFGVYLQTVIDGTSLMNHTKSNLNKTEIDVVVFEISSLSFCVSAIEAFIGG